MGRVARSVAFNAQWLPRSAGTGCRSTPMSRAPRSTSRRRRTRSVRWAREVVSGTRPGFDPARRKDRSRFLLAVSGGDGHHTVLSWAEIDADFGDAPMLLATRMDGADLDDAGAQLVVPSDRCGARYISAVTRIWVGTCRPPADGDA
ncbi:hypothetical protein ACGFYP_13960 [Streptomyces sp. NPDC048370]|uniref:hypothetical protein n=1 Tax=Streptomyces sp. NPDC048370 TaxID=3365540 RepID=UPI00371EBE50